MKSIGTYQWANATSIAGIIIALSSPFLVPLQIMADIINDGYFSLRGFVLSVQRCYGLPIQMHNYVYFTLTCMVIWYNRV